MPIWYLQALCINICSIFNKHSYRIHVALFCCIAQRRQAIFVVPIFHKNMHNIS